MTMKLKEVELLEKISGQMHGLHKEIDMLVRKSPNDGINEFKLKFVNAVISEANKILGKDYKPFLEFTQFNEDDLPSNSDVTFITGQYIEELERKRTDNIIQFSGRWKYKISDSKEEIYTSPPKKLKV